MAKKRFCAEQIVTLLRQIASLSIPIVYCLVWDFGA